VGYKTVANIGARLRKKLKADDLPALIGKAIKTLDSAR
jgi:hypothetical protein